MSRDLKGSLSISDEEDTTTSNKNSLDSTGGIEKSKGNVNINVYMG